MADSDERALALRRSLEYVTAERDALAAALRPFALIAGVAATAEPAYRGPHVARMLDLRIDNVTFTNVATVEDCRRAAAVLAGQAPPPATLADLARAHAALDRIEKVADAALAAGSERDRREALEEIAETAREGRGP